MYIALTKAHCKFTLTSLRDIWVGFYARCNVAFHNVSFFFMQNKDDCAVEVLVRTFFVIMIRQAAKWNENMMVEKSRLPNKL